MIDLLPLAAADPAAVEALLDAAFGPDRHGRTAYRLRTGETAIAALSFCMQADGRLAGTIQCWPVALADDAGAPRRPLVLVGPVAVDPARQGGGIGRALMGRMLAAADAGGGGPGHDALVLIGDPEYYGRFGFTAEQTGGWRLPGPFEPRRLLARTTQPLPRHGMLGPRG